MYTVLDARPPGAALHDLSRTAEPGTSQKCSHSERGHLQQTTTLRQHNYGTSYTSIGHKNIGEG